MTSMSDLEPTRHTDFSRTSPCFGLSTTRTNALSSGALIEVAKLRFASCIWLPAIAVWLALIERPLRALIRLSDQGYLPT